MVAFMLDGRSSVKGYDIETIQRRCKQPPLSYSSFVVVIVLEDLLGSLPAQVLPTFENEDDDENEYEGVHSTVPKES
jgi:hypothetical protein